MHYRVFDVKGLQLLNEDHLLVGECLLVFHNFPEVVGCLLPPIAQWRGKDLCSSSSDAILVARRADLGRDGGVVGRFLCFFHL